MSPVYLETRPPHRRQYYPTRGNPFAGQIVVHTAENILDQIGADTSAENVANFIANRADAGSYHTVVDSDSICRIGRYEWTMFHVGVAGVNSRTLGLAFACRTTDWTTMGDVRRHGFLVNGATEARAMSAWSQATIGVAIPARHLTLAQYQAGQPGFISHAQLDPARRSDPGVAFPWDTFLALYDNQEEPPMNPHQQKAQEYVNAWLVPELQIKTDGDWGEKSTAALKTVLDNAQADIERLRAEVTELKAIPTSAKVQSVIQTLRAGLNAAEKELGG